MRDVVVCSGCREKVPGTLGQGHQSPSHCAVMAKWLGSARRAGVPTRRPKPATAGAGPSRRPIRQTAGLWAQAAAPRRQSGGKPQGANPPVFPPHPAQPGGPHRSPRQPPAGHQDRPPPRASGVGPFPIGGAPYKTPKHPRRARAVLAAAHDSTVAGWRAPPTPTLPKPSTRADDQADWAGRSFMPCPGHTLVKHPHLVLTPHDESGRACPSSALPCHSKILFKN